MRLILILGELARVRRMMFRCIGWCCEHDGLCARCH